jgi:glucans biosynthesis protein
MIDFAEGDMAYYLNQPGAVEIVASATDGRVLRTFLVPNPAIKGFRVMLDVELDPKKITYVTCHLRNGPRVLTETWNWSWKIYDF